MPPPKPDANKGVVGARVKKSTAPSKKTKKASSTTVPDDPLTQDHEEKIGEDEPFEDLLEIHRLGQATDANNGEIPASNYRTYDEVANDQHNADNNATPSRQFINKTQSDFFEGPAVTNDVTSNAVASNDAGIISSEQWEQWLQDLASYVETTPGILPELTADLAAPETQHTTLSALAEQAIAITDARNNGSNNAVIATPASASASATAPTTIANTANQPIAVTKPTPKPKLKPKAKPKSKSTPCHPLPRILNAHQRVQAEQQTFDNEVRYVEGGFRSTLHHRIIVETGLPSHRARPWVDIREREIFEEVQNEILGLVPELREVWVGDTAAAAAAGGSNSNSNGNGSGNGNGTGYGNAGQLPTTTTAIPAASGAGHEGQGQGVKRHDIATREPIRFRLFNLLYTAMWAMYGTDDDESSSSSSDNDDDNGGKTTTTTSLSTTANNARDPSSSSTTRRSSHSYPEIQSQFQETQGQGQDQGQGQASALASATTTAFTGFTNRTLLDAQCHLEARAWTLEKIKELDAVNRRHIKAHGKGKMKKDRLGQRHLELPS